jgi:sulfur-oxidizing protein SoxB
MDVDLKLARVVSGIDAILGGHTHDGVPVPVIVDNNAGRTVVTNAGSNGKFLGVLDLEFGNGGVSDFRYRLLPVFSNLLPADADTRGTARNCRCIALSPRQFQRHVRPGDL